MRNLLLLLAAMLAGGAADVVSAHDFWIQPEVFEAEAGRPVSATLQVGHGPARQRSPIPLERITAFRSIGPDGSVDRRQSLSLGEPDADAHLTFATSGPYVVALETNGAFSNLPAIRFNDYLRAEGLTAALDSRRAAKAEDSAGRELYSRRAKAIIEVGPQGSPGASHVTESLGLSLEIVPDVDPSRARPHEPFGIRVLYNGQLLPGALVKLTDLKADEKPIDQRTTDQAGRARFAVPYPGTWLLNVIWSEPIPPTRKADFVTTFSSLSFGVGDHAH